MISITILIRLIIAILALTGFFIARHIHKKKKLPEPLVCPMKFNCHNVVHSDYSKFMGVPLEIFGMIYYMLIFLSYVLLLFISSTLSLPIEIMLIILSVGAFVFSIYLTGIQLFVLKEGCFWCFISAFISVVIFILTFFLYDLSYILKSLII